MRALLAAAVILLAVPGVAAAGTTGMTTRELSLPGMRTSSSVEAPGRFELVGLHWQGPGDVLFRTRSVGARWSAWRPAAPEEEDRPDDGAEPARPGWRAGNPYWVGPSDRLEYRVRGRVTRLRAHFVTSTAPAAPPRTLALAAAPRIIPRRSWGADESIRRGGVSYAPAVRFAVVHHTAGTNNYTAAQSAAIVKGIQLYHVRGNGWNDVGYNFLVDKYGQVFEGRYGGIERNVVGAHAAGFNTGSVGIAVLGNYDSATLTPAAQAAVAALIAWRLDVAHVDPLGTTTAVSAGNGRFARGVSVPFRAVIGHRDTGYTSCPGAAVYGQLTGIARAAAGIGLPKLYAPVVTGRAGGPVRFTGRLSSALPWTVTVLDAAGNRVAAGSGTGATVDWTWDARGASGRFQYSIAAGPNLRPASGWIGDPAALATPAPLLSQLRADPALVSPSRAPASTTLSYRLGAAATVSARLEWPGGVPVELFTESRVAGLHRLAVTAEAVPDATYRLVVTALGADGARATASVPLVVSRALAGFAAAPAAFSPNGDRRADTLTLRFELATAADVRVRIVRGSQERALVFAGSRAAGKHVVRWDGTTPSGPILDGAYEAEIEVVSGLTVVTHRAPVRVDTTAPSLRLVSARPLRVRVGEPGTLVVTTGGRSRSVKVRAAGTVTVAVPAGVSRVRVVAWDGAGNASVPLVVRR
jgi:hypothetical protein